MMEDQYIIPGGMLCTVCGLQYFNKSVGGPGICPSCDCGNTGPQVLKAQRDEIVSLRTQLENARVVADDLYAERTRLRAEIERLRTTQAQVVVP